METESKQEVNSASSTPAPSPGANEVPAAPVPPAEQAPPTNNTQTPSTPAPPADVAPVIDLVKKIFGDVLSKPVEQDIFRNGLIGCTQDWLLEYLRTNYEHVINRFESVVPDQAELTDILGNQVANTVAQRQGPQAEAQLRQALSNTSVPISVLYIALVSSHDLDQLVNEARHGNLYYRRSRQQFNQHENNLYIRPSAMFRGDHSHHGTIANIKQHYKREYSCMDYVKGRCTRGDACRFSHSIGLHDGNAQYQGMSLNIPHQPHQSHQYNSHHQQQQQQQQNPVMPQAMPPIPPFTPDPSLSPEAYNQSLAAAAAGFTMNNNVQNSTQYPQPQDALAQPAIPDLTAGPKSADDANAPQMPPLPMPPFGPWMTMPPLPYSQQQNGMMSPYPQPYPPGWGGYPQQTNNQSNNNRGGHHRQPQQQQHYYDYPTPLVPFAPIPPPDTLETVLQQAGLASFIPSLVPFYPVETLRAMPQAQLQAQLGHVLGNSNCDILYNALHLPYSNYAIPPSSTGAPNPAGVDPIPGGMFQPPPLGLGAPLPYGGPPAALGATDIPQPEVRAIVFFSGCGNVPDGDLVTAASSLGMITPSPTGTGFALTNGLPDRNIFYCKLAFCNDNLQGVEVVQAGATQLRILDKTFTQPYVDDNVVPAAPSSGHRGSGGRHPAGTKINEPCKFFLQPGGCSRGESCMFQHILPGGSIPQ